MNKLTIKSKKWAIIQKEMKIAKRRGWNKLIYGLDSEGYFVEFNEFREVKK